MAVFNVWHFVTWELSCDECSHNAVGIHVWGKNAGVVPHGPFFAFAKQQSEDAGIVIAGGIFTSAVGAPAEAAFIVKGQAHLENKCFVFVTSKLGAGVDDPNA